MRRVLDANAAASDIESEFECELWKPRMIRAVKSGDWIFQAGRRRSRTQETLVEEGNFRGNRKLERRDASHVIAVNVDDMEVTLDLLDESIETVCQDIDVVEFDSHRGDVLGTPKQIV